MRILVVEDELDLNHIICNKLTKEGYNVDACFDGQAALDYLETANYDGAIMDIMIPKKDGVHISNDSILNYGSLQIDTNNHRVVRDGVTVDLTVREYAILEYLVRNRNIVVTREQIRANIWSIDDDINSNVVDVYIRYLRRKIDDPFEEKLIHTIRGVGYRLEC